MKFFLKCLFFLTSLFVHLSCASPFVWVENLPPTKEPATQEYRIDIGDQIEVVVWDQPQISGVFQVRQDGIIGIPLIGELTVADSTPLESAELIKKRLEQGGIVNDVRVVVISRQVSPEYVTILGEVETPGKIELKAKDTLLDILAQAGGLTEFADKKSIYVLRPNDFPNRIRFNYNSLTSNSRYAINFKLKAGDIIVVE